MIKELKYWKTDVPSGLVVFLVAIPLCLGIALASGAPALSGVIAGIVGGLIVTLFSNSSLGVSGPAAGLVAIVLPAIEYLGFQNFLLSVVLAGVIQFVLGYFKAGTIGYYFPSAVIKGMLVAIGLIIILKQIPHAFGFDKDYEGDLSFWQKDGSNTFTAIADTITDTIQGAVEAATLTAVVISVVCLGILILWETKHIKKFSFSKIIQGPLVAVVAGIVLGLCFAGSDSMKLSPEHLVSLPDGTAKGQIQIFVGELGEDEEIDSDAMQTAAATEVSGKVFKEGASPADEPNAVLIKEASNGVVTLGKDGTFTYTPSEGFTGKDSFSYSYDSPVSLTFPHFAPSEIQVGDATEKSDNSSGNEDDTIDSDKPEVAGVSAFGAAISILITAVTLAVVASLESLLCAEATDKLDPQRRQTDLNKELRAQGLGNFVSGMIGGLPVTQVIVRSSTNIQSGAQSRLAAFVHGIFLIVCVLVIPYVLNLIPLASLAAILFVVGYKLAHPSKFKGMYKLGWTQFLPFMITIIAILLTDLLVGIGIGLVASLFFILKDSYVQSVWMSESEQDGKKVYRMTLAERVFFINKGHIGTEFEKVQSGSKLIIDASDTVHIDQDVIDLINDFETNAPFKEIEVERLEFEKEVKTGGDPARVKRISESQT